MNTPTQSPSRWKHYMAVLARALSTSRSRPLKGAYDYIARTLAAVFAAVYLYSAGIGMLPPEGHRALFLGFTLALVFLWYPARPTSPKDRFTVTDIVLVLATVVITWYFITEYPTLVRRAGIYTSRDLWLGGAAILLSLEAARRVVGPLIPIISVGALVFAYRGVAPFLPVLFAHRGFTFQRIISYLYTSMEGLYGTVTYTFAAHVFLFVIFGAFLSRSGVGQFFIDLPYALLGRSPGGSGKVAVAGSMLIGSVTGSPTANVVATGNFTIPLMKRTGYSPEVAGAIETAVSTGSQLLPPVMGAAAFFMVEFTGIPYIEVIKLGAIPAIVYFVSVMAMVHFHSGRHQLKGADVTDLPDWRTIFRRGWYLALPLVVLLVQLGRGYSPGVAAVWGIVACIVVSWFRPETRMGLRDIFEALVAGARDMLMIASVAGSIGIIVGIIGLTGLGLTFSSIILGLAGDSLFLAMVLTAFTALIVGTGAPITATYVILAVLVPPALARFGVPIAASHMSLLWFSQLSSITPPVCLVAFAAAAIAQGDPFRTGFQALKLGAYLIILPFMFVYSPLLFGADPWLNTLTVVSAVVSAVAFPAMVQGFFVRRNSRIEGIMLGLATIGLVSGVAWLNIVGLGIVVATWFWQRSKNSVPPGFPVGV